MTYPPILKEASHYRFNVDSFINAGGRDTQEDRIINNCINNLCGFGVCDGYLGDSAAEYCAEHILLPEILKIRRLI